MGVSWSELSVNVMANVLSILAKFAHRNTL